MDFKAVEALTSAEIAQKLQNDDYCNTHFYNRETEIDGMQLDDLIRGAVIVGAEPVDYPLTDGIYIYMKKPTGDVIALYIEPELTEPGGMYEVLEFSIVPID